MLAQNPETGEVRYQVVEKTFVREVDQIVYVVAGGTLIETTDEHPFFVEGEGFVGAGSLRTGDVLRLASGEHATVEKLWIEALDEKVPVYNFEVAEYHTYYVSEMGVLVHNMCGAADELSGIGEYGSVGGHHIHAKAAFKGDIKYDPKKGFSISQEFMRRNGINHQKMTVKQRELFRELYKSGRPNTLREHTRIAREALKAGGASNNMIKVLMRESLANLKQQGVSQPSRIPWYSQ